MNSARLFTRSPRAQAAGFSIIEIVLAVAIIATAFVAVLGILPVGLNASRQAQDATVVANILDVLHHRLQGEPLPTATEAEAVVSFSPALFDVQGVYLSPESSPQVLATAYYRADLAVRKWLPKPTDTSSLHAVEVALSWPVVGAQGALPVAPQPQVVVSFPVTALTGTDWPDIAAGNRQVEAFRPKIEF